jgi:hypothetical protein
MANRVDKWFKPTAHKLNWHADDSERNRRKNALNSRHGSLIKTGHALLGLSGVTKYSNPALSRKAYADAVYFFAKHKRKMELQGKPTKKLRRRV